MSDNTSITIGVLNVCEFCIKHGEGKKWYEVMANYSGELLNQSNRMDYIKDFFPTVQRTAESTLGKLEWAKAKIPLAYRFIRKMGTARMKNIHFGQVVPLEDAEKIIDMVQSITRIPCVCRSVTKGSMNARYCLVLGIDPAGIFGDYPDLKISLETLNPLQAKELLREFDQKGLVHSIWTFKTPFIGAICNCDRDCLAYRIQVSKDLMDIMFKAEYIAEVNPIMCSGCRNCQKMCQFGAVEYSASGEKCIINHRKCYGCGLCRNACPKQAIYLSEKTEEV